MSISENREEADTLGESQASASAVLRIVLDKEASIACDQMIQALKSGGSIRLSPSRFISYVVSRFLANDFEKDKELMLAEFFDSKGYVEAELRKADSPSEVGVILEQAMSKVRRMQDIKKRAVRSKSPKKKLE